MTAMLAPSTPIDAAVVGVFLWRLIQVLAKFAWLAARFLPRALSAVRRRPTRSLAET